MDSSEGRPVRVRRSAGRLSFLRGPVTVGRSGDPKTLGQALSIVLRALRQDVVSAARHYYLVGLVGARIVPRPVRFLLYRMAGVHVEYSDLAPGIFLGWPPSNLTIGQGTTINIDCFFDCLGKVTLGRNVMVGMAAMIVTSHHPIAPDGRPQRQSVGLDVVIGDGAWLGARSTILPGVTVGEGAVISAGAVVTRDCKPFAIYAGVPARLVGRLQTETEEADASH
jgi:maltose O-acetyltransferase